MVDDVITDGQTKVEAIEAVRAECGAEIGGILVAVDRLERNAQQRSASADLEARTGIPVRSIATIREICAALESVEIDGQRVLPPEVQARIEAYLSEYGVDE